jgi:hypothetical protein
MRVVTAWAAMFAAAIACHNRSSDESGPAPAAQDTTNVTRQVDPNRTGPPGTGGRAGNGTITPDSMGVDSSRTRVDTAQAGPPPGAAVPQDTLGPRTTDSTATDSASAR